MGIYGHMVNKPGSGEAQEVDEGDEAPSAAMKDLETTLKQLNDTIDTTLSNQGEYGVTHSRHQDPALSSTKEEPEFTLSSSPTYKGPLKKD